MDRLGGYNLAVILPWALLLLLPQELSDEQKKSIEKMRMVGAVVVEAVTELRRAGNLSGAGRHAEQCEKVCNDITKSLPDLAEPHWHKARVRAAILDDRSAIAELDALLKKEPAHAGGRYLRAILLFRDGRREKAAADLEVVLKNTKGLADDVVAVASGLSLWLKGERGKARKQLAGVRSNDAIEVLARLDIDEERFAEALEALQAGIVQDRGYLPFFEARAGVHLARAWAECKAGRKPEEFIGLALEEAEAILKLDANRAFAFVVQGEAEDIRAAYARRSGDDFISHLKRAAVHYSEALKRNPACVEALLSRANAQGQIAAILDHGTKEAAAAFEVAAKDCAQAVKLAPERAQAWVVTGGVHSNWARRCGSDDALTCWETALKAFETAVTLDKTLETNLKREIDECRAKVEKK